MFRLHIYNILEIRKIFLRIVAFLKQEPYIRSVFQTTYFSFDYAIQEIT